MNAETRERMNILGVLLDQTDYQKAYRQAERFLDSSGNKVIVTPNAEIIMAAQKNPELRAALNSADLCLPDGIGVVIASKILGKPLAERTTGFDFMMKLLELANKKSLSLFLLGGKPEVAEKAGEKICSMFPNVEIVGCHDGYFGENEEIEVVNLINHTKPDILLVAMGCPKQEIFMIKNKNKMQFKIAMGVGGSFDVLSGNVQRAPQFVQNIGLEWLYRLIMQPSRLKRVGALPAFLVKVISHRTINN
ncbi:MULTISPECIES: WecB/TagA/CpsF family glycosyltransferase [Tepidanaerobacter]|uniref:N-acetylglucosaminyldiphosphoundecaprenol N-acetyl-beta-D-mannosaminyltransferase n=1 Tax=Tepidanaerobacter syntrophicus TaxID=224999 RepID=A0A0U9HE08_9FIRM|nr:MULTISPECIES: WecB/TagA/CpsF family glycosyltransferase [Tepidanaerobacter]GAQ25058.1 N-acetylglucosaminyldiphosphoundecaprenol N-acetyl-beta-D-mannosaminyltransferase [Tepidanaerobacter syntrophicus]GLI18567.1 acetylglucosaminyldiphosphoundecaprenol acetyl-beta-D-mannosaminyltransferase [Tepidanaerobacter syntrophicus]GLI50623.1 acetylglucosaminyldiphosphoundecaprenol acetyl-beta-D-mannosaminyltransferase [Tepidanaerobacter syntrophicus]HHV82839.1 WecB/TagA/CpsF family glycosyltransferase [